VRGTFICFYATAVVGGATLGLVVGRAFLVKSHLGWRWIGYDITPI
jgi:hypothetical protein